MAEQQFKQCPSCLQQWDGYTDFLDDPALRLIGYQPIFEDLSRGLFLFNHACGTTLAVPVESLEHLYGGPRYAQRMTGEKQCPGFCLVKEETRHCPARCECAYVREIMQLIKKWRKSKKKMRSGRAGD